MSKNQVIVAETDGRAVGIGWDRQAAIKDSQARGFSSGTTRPATAEEARDFRALNQRLVSPSDFEAEARGLGEVRVAREDASHTPSYKRAKEYADRIGVPLVVVREGEGTAIPSRSAPMEINRLDAEDAQIYGMARRASHMANAELKISHEGPAVDSASPPAWFVPAGEPVTVKRSQMEDGTVYRAARGEAAKRGLDVSGTDWLNIDEGA